jgi:hypothetical protein
MKKIIIPLIALFVVFSAFCYADLSGFPKNFIKGEKFNGYIVVGKDGTATDVISQSEISLKVASYIGSAQMGITKLDSEMSLDYNLILIGNPCVNKLTAELLDNPTPCDKDFPLGKAYIKYIEKDGVKFIIVAGNKDKETKLAALYLKDFAKNELAGTEIVLETGETAEEKKDSGNIPPSGVTAPLPTDDRDESDEEKAQIIEEEKDEKNETQTEDIQNPVEEQKQDTTKPIVIVKEEKGFFGKIWGWFSSLFKK